jgi:ribosomal protein S18 acetylase RimI-like enzyme
MPIHQLRRLGAEDAAAYRALRLAGLAQHPCEFGAAFEEEAALPLHAFASRLVEEMVLGGFVDGALLGVAGFRRRQEAKKRHKGVLWGVYVAAQARRHGLGRALVLRVIEHARGEVAQLHATVASVNRPACALYRSLGFVRYGVEPRALLIAGRYYDQDLLVLPLDHGVTPLSISE